MKMPLAGNASMPPNPGKPAETRDFESLVRSTAPRTIRFIGRIVGQRDIAEDLAQEVFLHVLRHQGQWPPPDRTTPWILRIARNVALDHLRRHRVRARGKERLEKNAAEREQARMRRGETPPLQATSQSEQRAILEDAIAQIPDVYRQPFLLREQDDLSYEEIAEVMGISPKTVSTRLVRARRHLREILERRLGEAAGLLLETGNTP